MMHCVHDCSSTERLLGCSCQLTFQTHPNKGGKTKTSQTISSHNHFHFCAVYQLTGPGSVLAPSVRTAGNQQCPMIMTSAGQLPSKNIIHVVGTKDAAKIKEAVYSVLKLCEENKFSSVAFPALGTGWCRHPQTCREEPDVPVRNINMSCCRPLVLRSGWSQSLCSGGRHGGRRCGLCQEKTTKVCLQHKDPDFPDSHDDRVSQQHEEKGGRASAGKGSPYLPERYMSQILISQQSSSAPLKTKG